MRSGGRVQGFENVGSQRDKSESEENSKTFAIIELPKSNNVFQVVEG